MEKGRILDPVNQGDGHHIMYSRQSGCRGWAGRREEELRETNDGNGGGDGDAIGVEGHVGGWDARILDFVPRR